MAFYQWKPEFSVQVNRFDDQHKKLVSLIDQLHESMKSGQATAQMSSILKELESYAQQHFREEEILMERHQYSGLARQKHAHASFVKKLAEFKEDMAQGKLAIPMDVMTFLRDWLTKHIMDTDKKYGPFFNDKGII
jgi:hemerythrin